MRHYIFPIGFHEDYIMRRLLNKMPSQDDHITIITCRPAGPGNKTAYKNLEAWLSNIGLPHILDPLQEISCNHVEEAIAEIRQLIESSKGDHVIIDVSGGMRILALTTTLATILSEKNIEICIQSEQGQDLGCIPVEIIRIIRKGLTPEEKHLLETIIENPGQTAKQYAQILGRTEKTIQNRLAKLAKHHLIIRKGKGPKIYPSKWAKIFTTKTIPGDPGK